MIPMWIKLVYTVLALIVVIVYYQHYPLANFLWFSDIALIVMVPALWLESSLLTSMMAISVLLPELFWNLGYFVSLLIGKPVGGIVDYMFDVQKPRYLRALSLFHVLLPLLLLYAIAKLGYTSVAWLAQTALAWIVLTVCYFVIDPKENVNWVRGWGNKPPIKMPPLLYFGFMMLAFPLFIYLPTHFILQALFT